MFWHFFISSSLEFSARWGLLNSFLKMLYLKGGGGFVQAAAGT